MPNTLESAIKKHRQGLFADAKALYEEILLKDPNNADVLHLLGILLGQSLESAQAKAYLAQALVLQPNNATFHNSMGNICKQLNEYNEAEQHYKKAIELQPLSLTAYNNLAILCSIQDRYPEAIHYAEQAIKFDPSNVEGHFNLAMLHLKQNQLHAALDELRLALRLDPYHTEAHYALAQQLQQLDQHEEAMQHYDYVIKRMPHFADAHVNLGASLLAMGNQSEAKSEFKRALDIDPKHAEAHFNLGCLLLEQRNLKSALAHFMQASAQTPSADTYYNIGVIYMYQDHYQDAIRYLKRALELDSKHFAALNNLATCYLKMHNHPKAIEYYEATQQLDPTNTEIAYILHALKQDATPDRPPKQFIEHLFDQYATIFDQHLTEILKYETPKILYDAVIAVIADDLHPRKILDLGCGTGLSGKLFKELGAPLIGVDLSSQMIAIAEKKEIYDALVIADVHDALRIHRHNELILAADVLTYLGDLQPLFTEIKQALTQNGLFAFTIEIPPPDIKTYYLQTSIRYAHAREYIQALAKENNFTIITERKITLRRQANEGLPGMLYILKFANTAL